MPRNNLIQTIDTLEEMFSITFKLYISKFPSGLQSVLHLTTGKNTGEGGRIPGIWLSGSKLLVHWNNNNGIIIPGVLVAKQWMDMKVLMGRSEGGGVISECQVL